MAYYIAVLHKDAKSDFGVSFPDFPGCITAGNSIDEAKDMAHDALSLHIKGLLEDGEKIPTPSKLEDIIDDLEYPDTVAILVVTVSETKSRSVRVNITVPEDMLRKIDAITPATKCPKVVIPAKAGIQAGTGCRIKSGMTELACLIDGLKK